MRQDVPGGPVDKNQPANVGDTGSISGPEDPTCCKATKSMYHSNRACALEPVLRNKRSLCTATRESPCSYEELAQPKNKYFFKKN